MATARTDAADEAAGRADALRRRAGGRAGRDDIAGDIADSSCARCRRSRRDAETREDILLRGPRRAALVGARVPARRRARRGRVAGRGPRVRARARAPRRAARRAAAHPPAGARPCCCRRGRTGSSPVDSAELLLAATRRSIEVNFQFHDALMEGLSSEYQRERERWVRGAEAMRRETIGAILDEKAVDTDGAGRILGYDLRRHHLGLVLWAVPTPDDPQVLPRLERAATAASAHLEAGRPLMLSVDGSTMWAWARARQRAPARADRLAGRRAERRRRLDRARRAGPGADRLPPQPPRRGRHRQGGDRQPAAARHRHRLPRRRAGGAVRRRPRAHAALRARAPRARSPSTTTRATGCARR